MTSATEKEQAEIAKLRAEAEAYLMEAAAREAEARKTRAEAELAEHDVALRCISRAERERMERYTLLSDFHQFHYVFDGVVNEKSVADCLAILNTWDRMDSESDWHITINSPGGSVVDGFHLFDQLAMYSKRGGGGHHITMTVRGEAASMAGILLQAADERVIGPRAQILVHEIAAWSQGSIGAIKDDVKRLDMMTEQVIKIFLDRAEGKISRAKFKSSWNRKDWWLSAEEALKYGFVDRIG